MPPPRAGLLAAGKADAGTGHYLQSDQAPLFFRIIKEPELDVSPFVILRNLLSGWYLSQTPRPAAPGFTGNAAAEYSGIYGQYLGNSWAVVRK